MLHVLDLGSESADSQVRLADKACAWGISFPGVKGEGRGVLVQYLVNTVWWKDQFDSDLEEDSDE
jgi:hypothetical protein